MGCELPAKGYLEQLRKTTDREKSVLILDEVMTGFRVAFGGAQELFGIKPDLTTLGKIIGGGLPVGAYGGRSGSARPPGGGAQEPLSLSSCADCDIILSVQDDQAA